jgi:DNA-binding transcriptional MerR regulator
MAGAALLTIGELARLTGLTVKTVRFWSDQGLLPPEGRTRASYRRSFSGCWREWPGR